MHPGQTHHLIFSAEEVRKRSVSWEHGEPEREWSCLTLLAAYAPGVAPTPLRRETDPDGAPVVVMERLPGGPLGAEPMTRMQTASLARAIRQSYEVPFKAVLAAGLPERFAGPTSLPREVADQLKGLHDLSRCQDAGLVREALGQARALLDRPGDFPQPVLSVLGLSDRKPANIV